MDAPNCQMWRMISVFSANCGVEIQLGPMMPERQHLVDHALLAKDLPPQDGDGYAATQQRRQVVDGLVDPGFRDLAVQHHGHQERERQRQRYREHHVAEGHEERRPEPAVLCRTSRRSCPCQSTAAVSEQVEVGKREVERRQERPQGQDEEPDQPRQQEQDRPPGSPATSLPERAG